MSSVEAQKYEKAFLSISAVMLVLFLGALFYSAFEMGISLPGRGGEIDPTRVMSTPPFDDPGTRRMEPGHYQSVVVAQAWAFNPREIEVPAGSTVDFVMTSRDVIHGFHIEGTNLNAMVIPGQITRVSYTFEKPGEHLIICHEYCGAGHHNMYATLRITEGGGEASEGSGPGETDETVSGEEAS